MSSETNYDELYQYWLDAQEPSTEIYQLMDKWVEKKIQQAHEKQQSFLKQIDDSFQLTVTEGGRVSVKQLIHDEKRSTSQAVDLQFNSIISAYNHFRIFSHFFDDETAAMICKRLEIYL